MHLERLDGKQGATAPLFFNNKQRGYKMSQIILDTNKPIYTNDIKKGMTIKSVQLGTPISGVMMDNLKGNTRLIDAKGSEVGLFDEMGSVYSYDIIEVKVGDTFFPVIHTKAQLALKERVNSIF